jgi:hypothetical protein
MPTPSPESRPARPSRSEREMVGLTPWSVLHAAVRAVPALKYTLAVLGVVSAIAIVKGFGIDFRVAVFGTVIIVVLMAALVVFAALTKVRSPQVRAAALVMMWSFLALTILSAALLFTAAFFSYPKPLGDLFGPLSSAIEPPPLSTAHMRDRWDQAVATLVPVLQTNQNRRGAFGSELGKPNDYPDAWTAAQAIASLLSVWPKVAETRTITTAFEWLQEHKKNEGWVRYHHLKDEPASTEVTAWVGIAYQRRIEEGVFTGTAAQEAASYELRKIHTMISQRQNEYGAWPSWPLNSSNRDDPIRVRGGYATAIATRFLFDLNKPVHHETVVEKGKLFNQIDAAVKWIISEYRPDVRGWEHLRGDGLHDGLTTMYLSVLTEAKRQGFAQIDADRRYRSARTAWVVRWEREGQGRPISENYPLTQKQETVDPHGMPGVTITFPVIMLWYPECLRLVENFMSDVDLPEEERVSARRIQQHLWRRLPAVVDELTIGGETFRVAEMIFALGLVGKNKGWL